MNKKLDIRLIYLDDGGDITEVIKRDFKEFLNAYFKKY